MGRSRLLFRCKYPTLVAVLIIIVFFATGSNYVYAGNASITISKPGIAVNRWGANVSTDYLASGGLRVGDWNMGLFMPVYRFQIPKLGTLSGLQVKITATEHGGSGTDIYFGNQQQLSYFNGVASKLYTTSSSAEIDSWIFGEADSDNLTDYIEIMFYNDGGDDIEIFTIEVICEYAGIPDSEVSLVGTYQRILNCYYLLKTYDEEVGPMLGDLGTYTANQIYEDGIQKSVAVADSLLEMNGFSVSELNAADWGSWIVTVKEIYGSLTATWNLWQTVYDLVMNIGDATERSIVVGDIAIEVSNLANSIEPAKTAMENLALAWQVAVADGEINENEIQPLKDKISLASDELIDFQTSLTAYDNDLIGQWISFTNTRKAYLMLTEPFHVYNCDNSPPDQTDNLMGDYINFVASLEPYLNRYTDGSGTPGNPYQVYTREDLEAVNNDLSAHYILINDINLAGITYNGAVIGDFTGSFDGNGHVISNLRIIGGSSYVGLFSRIYGYVTNLGLENCNVTGSGYVGGLVGSNGGLITNCRNNTAVVNGGYCVGGLVGINGGRIIRCYSKGTTTATYIVGGLVGAGGGIIIDCYSTGSVTLLTDGVEDYFAGGLAGFGDNIISSYSTCNVSGGIYVGGLVGDGSATNSYSTGLVSGNERVGGLAGSGYASNSYSTGMVSANNYFGGLIGGTGSASNSFWNVQTSGQTTGNSWQGTGITTLEMRDINTFLNVDWDFVDENTNGTQDIWYMPANSYPILAWQNETVTPPPLSFTVTFDLGDYAIRTGGGELVQVVEAGKDAELPVLDIAPGWEFTGWDGKPEVIISDRTVTAKYSYNWAAGDGSVDNPYQITDRWGLTGVNDDLSAHYILMNDIDLAGVIFNKAIIASYDHDDSDDDLYETAFTGTFNGNGKVIHNLTIIEDNSTSYDEFKGLFGIVYFGGNITNLGVKGGDISGSDYIGGLAGASVGQITNCYNTASVSGGDSVGGLVGGNFGHITNSYSTGLVTGTGSYVGGLVGENEGDYNSGIITYGIITGSYSTGSVSGSSRVGGLVGESYEGSVNNCYSTGSVSGSSYVGGLVGYNRYGSVATSFWDIGTSGRSTSSGGTGKTTVQMQMPSTFIDAGWSTSEWIFVSGYYPMLHWDSDVDSDGDGLLDIFENYYGLDPYNPDSDSDGLNDYDEIYTYGTDPLLADTDGDGLSDGVEVHNYGSSPISADTDGDGLGDFDEINTYGTNPISADTDADGLEDGDEIDTYQTNPLVADTDGDGLEDGIEINFGTNPLLADSDGDGLSDYDEVAYDGDASTYAPYNPDAGTGTDMNANSTDTDADGLNDSAEVNTHGTSPISDDTDEDTMPDAYEVNNGLNPLQEDAESDLDKDGFSNICEYLRDTLPDDDTSVPTPIVVEVLSDSYSIQQAINSLPESVGIIKGDSIIVHPGRYFENLNFNGKNITLASLDPNDPNTVEATIIDGSQSGSVVTFNNGEDPNCILTGFTITNGSAFNGGGIFCSGASPMVTKNIIALNLADMGGAISCWNSTAEISNNIITENSANYSGGGVECYSSPIVIANNVISNNSATNENGGGISCWSCSPVITNNAIVDNSAFGNGGGIFCYEANASISDCNINGNSAGDDGGGIYCENSEPTISNTVITNCFASFGAGIYSYDSSPNITNSEIYDNVAVYGGGGIFCYNGEPVINNNWITYNYHSGIYAYDTTIEIKNNLIAGNEGVLSGGIACDANSLATIENNTIVENWGLDSGGIGLDVGSEAYVSNCILWDNFTDDDDTQIALFYNEYFAKQTVLDINHSNVEYDQSNVYLQDENCLLTWGGNNISMNPQFISNGIWDSNDIWWEGDYHLSSDSPCIDAGDPNYPEDPNKFDIDGDSRIIGGRIDIGADEYTFGDLSDFSGNGIVNFEDFAILAYYWEEYVCEEPDWCEGCDFDRSERVDFVDLRRFGENWLWQAAWYDEQLAT